MNWVTRVYLAIKNWSAPAWFHRLTEYILVHIIIPSLKMCGEMAIRDCQQLIQQASQMNVPGQDKFKYVFNGMREKYTPKDIKDSILNLIIELIFQELKTKRVIG